MSEVDIDILNIRKNKIVEIISDKSYRPIRPLELAGFMEVPENEVSIFDKVIYELLQEGEIFVTPKGKIVLPKNLGLFKGVYTQSSRGQGFVLPDKNKEKKYRVSERNSLNAINKDIIFYKEIPKTKNQRNSSVEVVKIIKRTYTQLVGIYIKEGKRAIVKPDNSRISKEILIPSKYSKSAVAGQKVLVVLKNTSVDNLNLEGEIVEILGHVNDPGVDILSIVKEYNIPTAFDENVYKETEKIPDEVSDEDIKGRNDLRNLLMVTIDGEDTKDIDDAVSLEKLENGNYKLGVHIADVSHYVKEGSYLDKEALNRGTSVYLVDRVIPMLPHKLSNGICSLNANVDRLSLSCIMEIDKNGVVVGHEILSAVINVNKRMTYTIVNDILTNLEDSQFYKENITFVEMFQEMGKLSSILREKRVKRGAIEFDLPETKIIVDENGKVIEIKPTMRNVATSLIEEFMLACNETVSEEYFWLDIPFVYRNHEEPDSEKMKGLNLFLNGFGYSLKGKGVHSRAIQTLLSKVESTPEENIINRVVLRSFKQARYFPENLGHFGLAAKYYSHFTSPIRRYPDLQIHRIINKHLKEEIDSYIPHLSRVLPAVCTQCSNTERKAELCEREVESLKKVEYMADKIGMEFDGVISGVTSWGIYVELSNNVEGMVPLVSLVDDYYIFHKDKMMYIGERHGKIYTLGDKMRVILTRANIPERTLDFKFVDAGNNSNLLNHR